ncbi:fatty acid desaturase [Sphingomonas bacterium]|uniref:fatty acid desaturase n=1 Tax=Sphingomonas bacterium TaxID=1895847 RepID=UPI001575B8B4|nr:fatty acid desaturase [Sphingomonas bacterium]
MIATAALHSRTRQALIGGALALAILSAWLAIHLYAMFFYRIDGSDWPLVLPMVALQCWLSVGMFIVSHDAMHGSLIPGRPRVNGAVGASLLFLYAGFGWRGMRSAHFSHHRAPGGDEDPDFDVRHPDRFWGWYATFLRRYFGWGSAAFVCSVVAVYWLGGVPVANIVLLYGLPAIASSMQLFYFGTYRPHRHADRFVDRHRARSEQFGGLASLLSCFHFGYHHEHHLSPNVPWWALPGQRRLGRPTTESVSP